MRHRSFLLALALAIATVLALPAAAPAAPDPAAPGPATLSRDGDGDGAAVLSRATEALYGTGTPDRRPEATLALRDLFAAKSRLGMLGNQFAGGLLARPTEGVRDPFADGYSARSKRMCGANICVHWVERTDDAATREWARTTLRAMRQVWRHHIGTLGYRRPATDGLRGGNAKFDVYLKELGSKGVYGYCAPERRVAGEPLQASGFCVLDNDFARSQFGRAPKQTLKVTAAHEFFHAIQFAYDFGEDPWLLESTATWMEERFAPAVDDNRAYLRYGQLGRPRVPLDLFETSGYAHYGNWTFWEFVADRLGADVVRQVWERAGTGDGLPNDYSTQALRRVLADHGGLPRIFAAYSAGNTIPGATYPEGLAYPKAPVAARRLSSTQPRTRFKARIDHLSSRSVRLRPDRSLRDAGWRLQVHIDAPATYRGSAAYLTVKRADGRLHRRLIRLDPTGAGQVRVRFSARATKIVTITFANASTRTVCDDGTTYACQGTSRDDDRRFRLSAHVVRR